MKKKCIDCKKSKKVKKFYENSGMSDGFLSTCIKCTRLRRRGAQEKIKGVYNSQVAHSKHRGHPAPDYTQQQLIDWCLAQPLYHRLHKAWKQSGYVKKLAPSCDRVDDYKPYTLDNIQLMTWEENYSKHFKGRIEGVANQLSKKVVQIHKNTGKVIQSFYSTRDAERKVGVSQSNIVSVCKGKRKTAGGFKWEYNKN
ncbi:MAG: hypothetical protein DRQ46_06375 [Gammaproteobacteria bacterium]|nr:MAG: hypothetical protein DRQ46_06375 [Gammaproteobacteria bacterium]